MESQQLPSAPDREKEAFAPKRHGGTPTQWRARERRQEHRDRDAQHLSDMTRDIAELREALNEEAMNVAREQATYKRLLAEQTFIRRFLTRAMSTAYPPPPKEKKV